MSATHDHRNHLLPSAHVIKKNPTFSQEDADHPPDSYSIPKHAELDWFVRNAFFERNYSTKGNSSASASNSFIPAKQLRKSDSSIIWIPKTQRRSSLPETKLRRAPPPIRLVPRRSDVVVVGGGKTEPSSPKVSCTGRVRQKKNKPAKKSKKKTPSRSETPRKSTSGTLWTRLRDVFKSGKLKAQSDEVEAPAMRWRTKRSKSSRVQQSSLGEPVPGSLTRFASGRKSDSWIMQMKTAVEEVDDDTVRFNQRGIELWSRRKMEAPEPLDCVRDWLDSGPASV